MDRHGSGSGAVKCSGMEQHGILRHLYCLDFSCVGQYLRQNYRTVSLFRRGMDDCCGPGVTGMRFCACSGSGPGRLHSPSGVSADLGEMPWNGEGLLCIFYLDLIDRMPRDDAKPIDIFFNAPPNPPIG